MKDSKSNKSPASTKKREASETPNHDKQHKKMKLDVLDEKRAFLADFGTNLPPKELFNDSAVSIEVEWDDHGKKILSAEIEHHDSFFKFEGKENPQAEKCYVGIFNKETNQLNLVPADYFHLHSSGPQKSSETINELQLRTKLERQDNLVGYSNKKKSMCSKFSTQKYARIQVGIEQQMIKKDDINDFGQKLVEEISTKEEITQETSGYKLVRDTTTQVNSEVYDLDNYLKPNLVELIKAAFSSTFSTMNPKEKVEVLQAKSTEFCSTVLRGFINQKLKTDFGKKVLARPEMLMNLLYADKMFELIKNYASHKNEYAYKTKGPVLHAFAKFYLTPSSTNYHTVKLHMDALIIYMTIMDFTVDPEIIAKDWNVPSERIKAYLVQLGCKSDSASKLYCLVAPVKVPVFQKMIVKHKNKPQHANRT